MPPICTYHEALPRINFSRESREDGLCGFITKDIISSILKSLDDKYIYVVGNRPMYHFIEGELNSLGIPRHKVYFEAFGVPEDITKVMGWPDNIDNAKNVQITLDYRTSNINETIIFQALCTEPLLNSIERQGLKDIEIETGCRSGECALCRTKLKSGKVFIPPEVTIRDIDKDYGFIHPCISYPLTDLHLDLTFT